MINIKIFFFNFTFKYVNLLTDSFKKSFILMVFKNLKSSQSGGKKPLEISK